LRMPKPGCRWPRLLRKWHSVSEPLLGMWGGIRSHNQTKPNQDSVADSPENARFFRRTLRKTYPAMKCRCRKGNTSYFPPKKIISYKDILSSLAVIVNINLDNLPSKKAPEGYFFNKYRMPIVLGPQCVEMTAPALVSQMFSTSAIFAISSRK
jgi:hypothetical protein